MTLTLITLKESQECVRIWCKALTLMTSGHRSTDHRWSIPPPPNLVSQAANQSVLPTIPSTSSAPQSPFMAPINVELWVIY